MIEFRRPICAEGIPICRQNGVRYGSKTPTAA